jgi:hypothetical protein
VKLRVRPRRRGRAEAGLEETTSDGVIHNAPGIDYLLTFVGVWEPWDVPNLFAFDVSDEDGVDGIRTIGSRGFAGD